MIASSAVCGVGYFVNDDVCSCSDGLSCVYDGLSCMDVDFLADAEFVAHQVTDRVYSVEDY